jgi:adenylate cyclase
MWFTREAVNFVARFPTRLHNKLLFAFLTIVAMLVVLGGFGLYILQGMQERSERLIALQRKIAVYGTVQHNTTRQLYEVSSALLNGTQTELNRVARQIQQFGYELDRLQLVEQDELELMETVQEEYGRFIDLVAEEVELARSDKPTSEGLFQSRDAKHLANQLQRLTSQLVNLATANMLDQIEISEQAYRISRISVIGLIIASVILALSFGYVFSQSILWPLEKIKIRLSEIARGNFGDTIDVPNRDELGRLTEDLNETSKKLGKLYRELDEQKLYIEDISNKISRYLPQQLYQSIFKGEMGTDIESHRKYLTVFFSDIRDFSVRAERLEPEALSNILNNYFSAMSKIAMRHGATIDKFMGDAILGFFGEPESDGAAEDAKRCINMAIEMQEHMLALRDSFFVESLNEPLEIRIGINSGYCTVGNFGSSDRIDYTIIGSPVIVAARLQDVCPPNSILVSGSTHALIDRAFDLTRHGSVSLKGISDPVDAFEVNFTGNQSRQLTSNNV